jgi:hypothetical protein
VLLFRALVSAVELGVLGEIWECSLRGLCSGLLILAAVD